MQNLSNGSLKVIKYGKHLHVDKYFFKNKTSTEFSGKVWHESITFPQNHFDSEFNLKKNSWVNNNYLFISVQKLMSLQYNDTHTMWYLCNHNDQKQFRK